MTSSIRKLCTVLAHISVKKGNMRLNVNLFHRFVLFLASHNISCKHVHILLLHISGMSCPKSPLLLILYDLTLIPAWINNHMPRRVWVKLFIHSQTSMVEVWEWISYFIPHFIMDLIAQVVVNFLSHRCNMLIGGLLNNVAIRKQFTSKGCHCPGVIPRSLASSNLTEVSDWDLAQHPRCYTFPCWEGKVLSWCIHSFLMFLIGLGWHNEWFVGWWHGSEQVQGHNHTSILWL